jgi:catechol 2,3-dioxygenase-like lactoylglutathione lyase family enzyme
MAASGGLLLAATLAVSSAAGGAQVSETKGIRIANVILRVADMGRSLAFYRDQLGLAVRHAGDEFSFLDAGGVILVLNKPERAPEGTGGGLAALTEIVLEVPDVRASFGAMKERGVPFRVDLRPVTSDGRRDLLASDFRDPDGHAVSLTGWVAK